MKILLVPFSAHSIMIDDKSWNTKKKKGEWQENCSTKQEENRSGNTTSEMG